MPGAWKSGDHVSSSHLRDYIRLGDKLHEGSLHAYIPFQHLQGSWPTVICCGWYICSLLPVRHDLSLYKDLMHLNFSSAQGGICSNAKGCGSDFYHTAFSQPTKNSINILQFVLLCDFFNVNLFLNLWTTYLGTYLLNGKTLKLASKINSKSCNSFIECYHTI